MQRTQRSGSDVSERKTIWRPCRHSNPLRSGWIHGEQHLFNRAAILEAQLGKGRVFLLGPEVTFRAQPHGTFKFLFNGIY